MLMKKGYWLNSMRLQDLTMNRVAPAAEKFISPGETISGIKEYGRGIIHNTYLVKLCCPAKQFILQRMNTHVFTNPAAIMHNLKLVSEHIRQREKNNGGIIDTGWQMLRRIPTNQGSDCFIDADGNFWRALSFIRGAVPLEQVSSPAEAGEMGRVIGIFHSLTSDLDPHLLYDTLPGFHNVEQYLKHYDGLKEERRNWAPVLENGRREKKLKERVIHGDPKINNIMLDSLTGRAVSIIDLDTIMSGPVHYDIGDALRSCCNTAGEETADLDTVGFDLKRCKAFLAGYTKIARSFLTDRDFDFFFDAVRLVPFELGLRFYTDFLEGNVYFRVSRPDQNLARAKVQFKLVESIEQQEEELRLLIEEYRTVS
jgi:Ser/Thr protein kinase RdoA (MazF antagonist)